MSIAHISKNPINICLPEGTYCSFFNEIISPQKIYFYQHKNSNGGLEKIITILDMSSYSNRRCLQYQMFDEIRPDGKNNSYPVIYMSDVGSYDSSTGTVSEPVFECISPAVSYIKNKSCASITFWTNLTEEFILNKTTGNYKYEPKKILKIDYNNLESFKFSKGQIIRALCSANIEFHTWYRKVDSNSTTKLCKVPVITSISVLRQITSDYPVLDFSISGSSGGGNQIHSHINNSDCGFAFAVFHPGTGVPLGNPWKS